MIQVAPQHTFELEKKYLQVHAKATTENVQSLEDWLLASQWMCMVESSSFDFPGFPGKNEVFKVFYCTVENQEISNLFRTILALGGFVSRIAEYQREQNLFVFRLYQSQEQKLLFNLAWIQGYIEKELRFKKVIQKLIANEKRYLAEQRLLRNELF